MKNNNLSLITENGTVRTIQNVNDLYAYPASSDLVKIIITAQ